MTAYLPKGRTIRKCKVPRRDGTWVSRTMGTRDPNTARKMQGMLRELGPQELRAWDVLELVTGPERLSVAQLWDWWAEDGRDIVRLRQRLAARKAELDLVEKIPGWVAAVKLHAAPATAAKYEAVVRTLCDGEGKLLRSQLTPERILHWLASRTKRAVELVDGERTVKELPLATGARRKYYAGLSSFLTYLRSIGVIQTDLLIDIHPPAAGPPRDRHLETAEVLELAKALPAPHGVLCALMAGTGMELSVALKLRAADIDAAAQEIRARGKKTARHGTWRDRIVKVATWAWPMIEAHVAGIRRPELLFPGIDRWTARDAHAAACTALEIRDYTLRDHRHTWAVRAVKSGMPIELVARQMGHVDGTLVLKVYGRYAPRQEEREKWERIAAAQDVAAGEKSGTTSGTTGEPNASA